MTVTESEPALFIDRCLKKVFLPRVLTPLVWPEADNTPIHRELVVPKCIAHIIWIVFR